MAALDQRRAELKNDTAQRSSLGALEGWINRARNLWEDRERPETWLPPKA
jgi:hypothetical protein